MPAPSRVVFTLGVITGLILPAAAGVIGLNYLLRKTAEFERKVAVAQAAATGADHARAVLQKRLESSTATIDEFTIANGRLREQLTARGRMLERAKADLASLDSVVKADEACYQVCRPALDARDGIIREATAQRDSALVGWRRADSLFMVRTGDLLAAQEVVAAQEETIIAYEEAVEEAPMAELSFWEKLVPHAGVGAYAGYSVLHNQPDAGVGVTFGWSF